MEQKNVKKTAGFWGFVWALGLAGQLCWNMENQWFNTFVYEKIAKDPTIISWMVAISATATTISTFVTGTATDRRGRRRLAVSIGYILWGIFTILFGTTEFIMKGAGSGTASVLMTAGVAVVAADAIMSFFGSMGNDSGFNAWMNDHMNERNKGQIGAALATQPIIGTIVGTVAGGMLIGSENNYMRLFVVMGAFVICCGIFSLVFMKDAPDLEPHIEGTFWQQFASVFNFKKYFSLKELVWVNLTLSAYFIAFNMYFTHLGNYMIYYLGFTADMMGFMEGIGLILAMLLVFPATKLINAGKHVPIAFASIFFNITGLLVLGFLVRPENVNTGSIFNPVMLIGVFLIGVGYVVFLQTVSVWAKGLYPKEAKGQFEGIRILFFVLIPMVVAPLIANPIIKKNGEIINEYGLKEYLPTEVLFLVGAGVSLITFIPLIMAARYSKKGSAK
ncbi:Major Facilitator Superfamily protein [Lachnospiraceae bacterium YSD2013]|nr:Major Facilitator Superfamily protein [Lachnospiraceae bacterium YSD2013]